MINFICEITSFISAQNPLKLSTILYRIKASIYVQYISGFCMRILGLRILYRLKIEARHFFFEKWKVLRQGIYLNYVRLYFVMAISCDIAGIDVLMC